MLTYGDKKLYVNELLCYVSYHLRSGGAAPENIKWVALAFYDESQINNAKRLLWQCTKPGILRKFERRNTSVSRSSKEADMNDIMQAFSDIDKKGYDEVVYVCADVSKMPKQNPEEIHDLSILNRLHSLEQHFKALEAGISHNQIQITDFQNSISDVNNTVATHEKLISDNATKIANQSDSRSNVRNVDKGKDKDKDKEENKELVKNKGVPTRPRSHSDPMGKQLSESYKDIVKHHNRIKKDVQNEIDSRFSRSHGKSTNGGDNTLGRKQSRFASKSFDSRNKFRIKSIGQGRDNVFLPNRKANKFPQGIPTKQRMDSTGFMLPGEQWKKAYRENKYKESDHKNLFIYNVPVKYSLDDLYDHLCYMNIDILNIRQSSHLEARRKSFVVTVHKSLCNAIIHDDTLAYMKIGVREYIDKRSS